MRRLLKLWVLVSVSCTLAPKTEVDVALLTGDAPFFRALYDLDCCRLRGLHLLVTHGSEGTSLEVAGGPSGTAFAVWISDREALQLAKGNCLLSLGRGKLPLPDGSFLPVSEKVFASLLTGRLPVGGRPAPENRWSVDLEGARLELEVAGGPPRWVRGWLWGEASSEPIRFSAGAHHGRVPGEVRLQAPGGPMKLELVEFQPASDVPPPTWLRRPPCGAK